MQAVNQCSVRKTSNPFLAMFGWVIVASLAVSLPHAGAQDSFRVGIVDPQVILKKSVYGKRKRVELEEHASARQKVLESDREDIDKFHEKLQASKDASDAELQSMQEQLQRKVQKFEKRGQTFQQELSKKENDMMGEYIEKLKIVSKTVAERKGFALIAAMSSVLYASQGLDITKDVLKEFETLYP